MKHRFLPILVSILTLGGFATLSAEPACCASPVRGSAENAPAVNPARLMLASYEKISNALADDDLPTAQAGARTLASTSEITGTNLPCAALDENCKEGEKCAAALQAVIETKDIEEARRQFKVISAQAIKLAATEDGFYVMHCPMAGKNADWVQSDPEIRNPYHGSRMLHCGIVKSGG